MPDDTAILAVQEYDKCLDRHCERRDASKPRGGLLDGRRGRGGFGGGFAYGMPLAAPLIIPFYFCQAYNFGLYYPELMSFYPVFLMLVPGIPGALPAPLLPPPAPIGPPPMVDGPGPMGPPNGAPPFMPMN